MKFQQSLRVLRHAVEELRRGNAIGIFQRWVEYDTVFFLRQILSDDAPHGGVTEALAKVAVEVRSPDRIVAPRIAARHRERTARGLESPLRAAHESARGVGLVKLQAVNVLAPQTVRAAKVILEQADDGAEWMQHQPPADEAGRVGESVRRSGRCGEQQKTWRANAIGGKHSGRCFLKMFLAFPVHVSGTGNKSAPVRFEAANARAGDELHALAEVLRPMRDVHRTFRAFDATPHAGGALCAGPERTVGASGNRVGRGPPMPAKAVMRLRDAAAHRRERRWRQRRALAPRRTRSA